MRKRLMIVFFMGLLPTITYSWNLTGHRLVAQIAIDQLDKKTVTRLNRYNHAMDKVYQPMSLVHAAIWLDIIRSGSFEWLTPYHYINTPFTDDGTSLPPPPAANVVSAIGMAQEQFNSPSATDFEKGLALRILLHTVGDIHQPMHSITRFSKAYPEGDLGGNLYTLANNHVGSSLHKYWDSAGGYLLSPKKFSKQRIRLMAKQIEKRYPCHQFYLKTEPKRWTSESFILAKNFAYSVPEQSVPDKKYQQKVQAISQQRIAMAGCRLAYVLRSLNREAPSSKRKHTK